MKTLSNPVLHNICPKGFLCGRHLKNSVRNSGTCPFVRPDFGDVSSLWTGFPYRFCGRYSQGIRDHSDSRDRSVLQKHTNVAQHVTCQKSLSSTKSPRLANGRSFKNWGFLDSFCKCRFTFLTMFFKCWSHKMTFGPPLLCGWISPNRRLIFEEFKTRERKPVVGHISNYFYSRKM